MEPALGRPATPPSVQLVRIGAPIALRDGSRVHIRQLRDSDRQLLLRGFRRLTPESRYRRFLAPTPTLSEGTVHLSWATTRITDATGMDRWRQRLFIAIWRNSANPVEYLRLPDWRAITMGWEVPL
jgi:K+ transporter